ncbi:MAG TPA: anti-sigma factor [bacterium]|nr:anti-sigma factor [bacterium]
MDYAMDGLPEGQQDKVRTHLSACPRCREQVRDYWQVREGLGLCSQQHEAPDDLCAKVLARLNEAPRVPAGAAAAPGPLFQPAPLRGWPRFWMFTGPAFAALSLVMTLVALSALSQQKAQPAAAQENELASISNAVINDPRAARVVLAAAGPSQQANGLLVLCPGMDHAYFHCDHLSPCPLGRDYVLWMKSQDSRPRRLARFAVEQGGAGVYLLQFDSAFQASGPVEFMVTQQGGGAPSGPTWLKGSVSL